MLMMIMVIDTAACHHIRLDKTGMCEASSDKCFPTRNTSLCLLNISVGITSHGKCIKQLFYFYATEYVIHDNIIKGPDRVLDGEEPMQIILWYGSVILGATYIQCLNSK